MPKALSKARSDWKRVPINVFIVLHVYIILFWGLPNSDFRRSAIRGVESYVVRSGLWHNWGMFAPNPMSQNISVEGVITFQDGEVKVWQFPRLNQLTQIDRVLNERYRKWGGLVRLQSHKASWGDTARFVARLNHDNPANPPVRVELVREWSNIPKPQPISATDPRIADFQPMPAEFTFDSISVFFKYDVKPEDL